MIQTTGSMAITVIAARMRLALGVRMGLLRVSAVRAVRVSQYTTLLVCSTVVFA